MEQPCPRQGVCVVSLDFTTFKFIWQWERLVEWIILTYGLADWTSEVRIDQRQGRTTLPEKQNNPVLLHNGSQWDRLVERILTVSSLSGMPLVHQWEYWDRLVEKILTIVSQRYASRSSMG